MAPALAAPMRVLVACEYSGAVRDAFRAKGHDAMCAAAPNQRDYYPASEGEWTQAQAEYRARLAAIDALITDYDTLRSKALPSQTNELLLKVIAHNIVCLIHSMFELGIEVPTFSKG